MTDTNVFARATQPRWEQILTGIHAEALDCLQASTAIIADEAYGSGAHRALGCWWRFPARDEHGSFQVQPSLFDRMDQARDIFGLEVSPPEGPLTARDLRELAGTGRLYVVSEAYDLRWLPYARATVRYREMPHSFLVERGPENGTFTVIDGYYADTEWGRARPGAWTLTADEFDVAVAGEGVAVRVAASAAPPVLDRAEILAANAATARTAKPSIGTYIDSVRAGLERPQGVERLVLDIWHILRERMLHSLWLGDDPLASAVAPSVHAWQHLATQSYVAMRRARRGAAGTSALLDGMARALHADAELVAGLAPEPVADPIEVAVIAAVQETLRLVGRAIDATEPLRSLPGFDSFRLVEIIDLIESRLGVPFPADAPGEDLIDVAGLCRLFACGAAA